MKRIFSLRRSSLSALFVLLTAFDPIVAASMRLDQQLPIQIGATKSDVFQVLGKPAVTDFEWIYNDAGGYRHYYVGFDAGTVSIIKVANLDFDPAGRTEKLVNGLTFRDDLKKWIQALGKPIEVQPYDTETMVFWNFGRIGLSLTIDATQSRNTWFCIELGEKSPSFRRVNRQRIPTIRSTSR